MNLKFGLILLFCFVLLGCGGGGESTSPTPIVPPISSSLVIPKLEQDGLRIYYPDVFSVNQSASLAVIAYNSVIQTVLWHQTSGPELKVQAPNSQVISFDVLEYGNYSFDVIVVLNNDQKIQKNISFRATEQSNTLATVRLDHAAVEQAKVSLRADSTGLGNNKTISSIQWQQVAGPTVNGLNADEHYLFFTAPTVEEDTLLEFSATLTFNDNSVASDQSYVLIKNVDINKDGYFPKYADHIVTTEVKPYVVDSKYADVLVDCVYNNHISSSCNFATLPLLGHETLSPTLDDILARLVVSHPWMGDRFKQFLQESATADDIKKLLRATTAIVIAYDVRPSFYWSATGAIYLDAANFFLSPQERDTLNDQADYRSNFGSELKFFMPWRYVKNNAYYIRNSDFAVAERVIRPFSALEANASWLMYHELGHANDFFPPSSWSSLLGNDTPLSYANNHDALSSEFSRNFPLTSNEMKQLAKVSFAGNTASESQKALEAQDIVSFFTPDIAPDYYCYSTIREDYATLFGHFMMAYRLGVSADVAIVSSVNNEALNVTWGQRNRINSPAIQSRVRAVVEGIFPQLNVVQIQASLPSPINMRAGDDWFNNINLSSSNNPTSLQAKSIDTRPLDPSDFWQEFPRSPSVP
jgi:hypothetical protein